MAVFSVIQMVVAVICLFFFVVVFFLWWFSLAFLMNTINIVCAHCRDTVARNRIHIPAAPSYCIHKYMQWWICGTIIICWYSFYIYICIYVYINNDNNHNDDDDDDIWICGRYGQSILYLAYFAPLDILYVLLPSFSCSVINLRLSDFYQDFRKITMCISINWENK